MFLTPKVYQAIVQNRVSINSSNYLNPNDKTPEAIQTDVDNEIS